MLCRMCEKEIPEGSLYCNWCGKPQKRPVAHHKRGNGQGTVYKRGTTWTAKKSTTVMDSRVTRSKGGFATKKEAYAWLSSNEALFTTTKASEYADLTFTALYSRFLERHVNRVSKSTISCYKAAYGHFKGIYNVPFKSLTTEDWQECVDAVPGKRTRENMKALGTLMYKMAMEQQMVDKDYAHFIWIGKGDADSSDGYNAFTRKDIRTILQAANDGDRDAQLIAIAIYTGFRPSALFLIQKKDYDGSTLVGGIKTEAGKGRSVPVSKVIKPFVDQFAATAGEYLFRHGAVTDARTWRENSFYSTLARLGIQKETDRTYQPYSCRHTFATMLKTVEGNATDKAALMGHTSPTMTLHYQHAEDSVMHKIIAQLS